MTALSAVQLRGSSVSPIFDIGNHNSHLISAYLPIDCFNVLRQMRATFDQLEELAESIKIQHLLHPLIVAQFDQAKAVEHLAVVNSAWNTHYTLGDLRSLQTAEGTFYFILIAGERRFRAHQILWEKGCQDCREKLSPREVESGGCYIRHFGDNRLPVRIRRNADPSIVLTVQLTENTYVVPPPHELATAFAEYFPVWQKLNPKGKLTDFAKLVNRSDGTIRDYLRYEKLPEDIHEEVKTGAIAFGIAIEISRLYEDGLEEKELSYWVLKAKAGNFPIPVFREMVSNTLRERHSGQTSMWDMFDENARDEAQKQDIRLILERVTTRDLYTSFGARRRVIDLIRDKRLGHKDSPFSSRSVIRLMRKDNELAREENELFRHLLGEDGYQLALQVIEERDQLTTLLMQVAERE